VIIKGKLLIPCGLRIESRVGRKENEEYELLETEEWSTEEEAVVMWPSVYDNKKEEDWYIRILYGENMKQV
jgi:predicted nucleotidyltransferase